MKTSPLSHLLPAKYPTSPCVLFLIWLKQVGLRLSPLIQPFDKRVDSSWFSLPTLLLKLYLGALDLQT